MTSAVLIGQGDLPRALLESAKAIVPEADNVRALSNFDCPIGDLCVRLNQTISDLPDGNVVIFADMFGSSCANAGIEAKRNHPHIALVTGMNLAMLVRFLAHRNKKTFSDLIPFLVETGRTAIRAVEL